MLPQVSRLDFPLQNTRKMLSSLLKVVLLETCCKLKLISFKWSTSALVTSPLIKLCLTNGTQTSQYSVV